MSTAAHAIVILAGAAAGAWYGFEANGTLGAFGGGVTGGVMAGVASALGIPQLLRDAPDSDGDGVPDVLDSNDRHRW
jgi:hypothetical protein